MGFETRFQPSMLISSWDDFEALPMGFETLSKPTKPPDNKDFEALPMGFETQPKPFRIGRTLYNFEALPMGFETSIHVIITPSLLVHFEALPMGFETTLDNSCYNNLFFILKHSLWDLKLVALFCFYFFALF